jgi:hypothetical protein
MKVYQKLAGCGINLAYNLVYFDISKSCGIRGLWSGPINQLETVWST